MDVRGKLFALLQDCNNPSWKWFPNNAEMLKLVDYLIAHGVTVQEWVKVEDRLPENDYGKHWKNRKYYLVRTMPGNMMCVAHYGYKEYDWWIDDHDCVLSATNYKEVTHWMPLPQPPKGD